MNIYASTRALAGVMQTIPSLGALLQIHEEFQFLIAIGLIVILKNIQMIAIIYQN